MVRNKVLVLTLLLIGAGSTAVAGGLMRAHYEFEGNYNNSITGPAGVPHGNTHIVPDPGGNGKGASDVLSLDGTGDYVRFGNDSVSGITGTITLTCWIKTGSLPDLDSLVTKGYAWRLMGDSGPGQFATVGLSSEHLHGTINLADGQWHHLAGVYDATQKYLYVDGNLDSHTDCTGLLNTWGHYVFSAGALLKEYSDSDPYDGFPKFFYAGLIDDIRVYDYALSEGEIESIISGDCNDNGIPDDDDIAAGTSSDCNGNGFPDECDIADGRSGDCNTNGIPDECEPDCNGNGISDDCDIADATSADTNENGVPDECENQYEAEDAVLNGTEAYAHQGASGGYRVHLFNETGDYILYDNVIDANYLEITYSLGLATDKQCSVYIDGNDVATAVFSPTGDWDTYRTLLLEVDVKNSVKLQLDADDQTANADETCASQDKIALYATQPGTVEWVCRHHPDRVINLFGVLNLDFPGLQNVKAAVNAGQWETACTELLLYYQTTDTWYGSAFREPQPPPTTGTVSQAEDLLNDIFIYNGIQGSIMRLADGSIDWNYTGPLDSEHWANNFCRVYWVNTLVDAYLDTGNINYSSRLDKDIADFVINYPVGAGPHVWQHLNAGIRARSLARVFFRLLNADEFQPATRVLMLSSLAEHADFLRHNHRDDGNQKISELHGLARIAVGYPELTDSPAWADYVGQEDAAECNIQVYPDGVQYELSFSYHDGVAGALGDTADELRNGGYTVNSVLDQTVEDMYNYEAWALRPDGNGPLNGDSGLSNYVAKILSKADVYGRNDWKGMVNYSSYPAWAPNEVSAVFPWAGHAIFRSGWDADAHWSFFDIGPFGQGHVHSDKLHISIAAFGRDLIADSGKWHYDNYHEPWGHAREYFIGTFGHNGLIFDGLGQRLKLKEKVASPISQDNYLLTAEFDYARGVTTEYDHQGGVHNGFDYNLPGTLRHTRAVLYVRGKYWVVVDDVVTDRTRSIDTLWQFAPGCTAVVDTNGEDVKTTDAQKGNIRIVPVADHTWSARAVIGEGDPESGWDIQNPDNGWYSRTAGAIEPSYTAIYSAQNVGSSTFAWILVPADGDVPEVTASVISNNGNEIMIRVEAGGQNAQYVTVPITSGTPQVVSESAADFDNDGDVDIADLAFIASQWLSGSPQPHPQTQKSPDLLLNGLIDYGDFALFAKNWLTGAGAFP